MFVGAIGLTGIMGLFACCIPGRTPGLIMPRGCEVGAGIEGLTGCCKAELICEKSGYYSLLGDSFLTGSPTFSS